MSTEKILNKINQEAETAAAGILAAAKAKADASTAAILDDAKKKVAEIQRQSDATAEEIHKRNMLVAGLEGRKSALAAKRTVLDEAFAMAAKTLNALPQERYEALVTAIVLEAAQTGEETLQIPQKDAELYQGGFLDKLNAALQAAGKKGALKLSENYADISGGVILIGEKSDVNGSFEAVLRETRERCEREVSGLLFGSEVK